MFNRLFKVFKLCPHVFISSRYLSRIHVFACFSLSLGMSLSPYRQLWLEYDLCLRLSLWVQDHRWRDRCPPGMSRRIQDIYFVRLEWTFEFASAQLPVELEHVYIRMLWPILCPVHRLERSRLPTVASHVGSSICKWSRMDGSRWSSTLLLDHTSTWKHGSQNLTFLHLLLTSHFPLWNRTWCQAHPTRGSHRIRFDPQLSRRRNCMAMS